MSEETEKFTTVEQLFVYLLSFVIGTIGIFALCSITWIFILTSYHGVVAGVKWLFDSNIGF